MFILQASGWVGARLALENEKQRGRQLAGFALEDR
jgi:hypothetical protein